MSHSRVKTMEVVVSSVSVTGHSRLSTVSFFSLHPHKLSKVPGMASIIANLPLPIYINGVKPSLKPTSRFPVCAFPERQRRVAVVVKATGDRSESSTSLSIVESVQNVWDKPEDRVAVIGLGLTAIIALWASLNLVSVRTMNLYFALDAITSILLTSALGMPLLFMRLSLMFVILLYLGFGFVSNPSTVAIDKLPLVPSFLEFVGILFSGWFVYRYLLFKPEREEFFRNINKSISNILGQ